MVNLYNEDELLKAQKKLKFYNYLLVAIVCVSVILFLTLFFISRSIEWGESTFLYRVLASVVAIIASCSFLFIYNLPRRMCKGYVKVYKMAVEGNPKPIEGIFLGIERDTSLHFDIDCYEMLFFEGINAKGREIIGRIFVDAEKDISDMEIGDKVRYCSCGTMFSSYEILEKNSIKEDEIDVLIKRLEDHISMDIVLYGDNPKKKTKKR